ncbi:MAG: PKD domain-containing protein, partial [Planctomycetota bacterium]|nr:PKD domain-containing protein [Planctomycetota bacterium]
PQLGLSFVLDAAVAAGSDMYFVILHGGAQLEPSPGVPSGPVPALGIIDARSLGMDGIDAAISTALRQRGRLAIFERDVLGIDWTPDRPPTTSGIDDVVVSEGAVDTVINLFSAFEDDRDADAELTYSIIENTNPGLFDATTIDALAGTLTLDYGPDDGTAQITVEATDTSGQSVATTFSVIISNVAPSVIAIDMRDVAVRSQTLEYAASFVDAGIADTHAASIDWGDGSPLEQVAVIVTSGAGAVSGSHAYATAGVYTVLLTIEDDDGGRAAAQHQIIIKTATVLDDPERPGQQALFVGGTLDNDRIFISQFFNTFVSVYIAPQRYWRFFAMRNDQHVYVYAGEGNDHVRISANNRLDAMVFGGPGNDRLHGGRGNDILDGGPGNDRLYGNSGNDILLGGAGRDRLFGHGGRDLLIGGPGRDFLAGSSGDDILIGGTTSHDTNHAALAAVMAEWTSPRSINARIGHLRNGGGLNGSYLLKIHETIFDDDKCDLLWGARGRDWFVFFESDYCFDQGRRDR